MTTAAGAPAQTEVLRRARRFLTAAGLQAGDDDGTWTPLAGGVSSDLWRVDLPDRTLCVKAALAQLRVADLWTAPVDRNAVEYAWLRFAARHRPGAVPETYAHDAQAGFFAMQYLPEQDHPVWKAELLRGHVDPGVAAAVGDLLGALHAASARDPEAPTTFATDRNFAALRLDPYLRVTGGRNPAVADRLEELAVRTARTHLAVVHGDVSPKNVLVGPSGPVLLDAECAWFGDPAFDVAFVLTHLALKMQVVPAGRDALRESARALVAAYAPHVAWEDPAALDGRVATLLPALLLARVDGASPVEYLSSAQRDRTRATALELLREPADRPLEVVERWAARTA